VAPAKVEELIHGYVVRVPVDELAARFQVDQSTVQKHARRHGLPRRSPRLSRSSPRKRPGCIWPVSRWPSWLSTLASLLTLWLSPYAGPGRVAATTGRAPLAGRPAEIQSSSAHRVR
jgi:hypothetical protein